MHCQASPLLPLNSIVTGDYRSAGLVVDSVIHNLKGLHQSSASGSPANSTSSQSYEPLPVVRLSSKDFVGLGSALRALIGGFVGSQMDPEVRYISLTSSCYSQSSRDSDMRPW